MNKKIRKIIYRDYGFDSFSQYMKKCFLYPETKVGCQWRLAQFYATHKSYIVRLFWKIKWLRIRKKTKCQISLNANIGPGFKLLHDGPRVIVSGVNIGQDCMIGINVIIGKSYTGEEEKSGKPTIGDRVYIGHNVSIVGDITVGNDVLIAPNTFVNRNVPDHSIVLGNNVIIHKQNPSAVYLNKLIGPNCGKQVTSV